MARIILIEDERLLLKTLTRFLEVEGHEVRAVGSAQELGDDLSCGRFDLLISDIFMPGFSGIDVLRKLMESGCQEPIVLMTGEPNVDTAAEAVRLGAFDYLTKPVTQDKLLELVSRAMRQHDLVKQRDEARQREMALLRNLAQIGEQSSVLTHEIRAPISGLHHALSAVADRLSMDQAVLIEEMIQRLERIEDLLNSTLSFARPLDLNLCEIPASELIVHALEHYPNVDAGVIRVQVGDGVVLRVDAGRMEEVLVNLVQNALDATENEGPILIRAENGEKGVEIVIEDGGPGIPDDKKLEVFELFHSSKATGTGIGLPLCRKIVESHGGTLALHDGEMGGAAFHLLLQVP